VPYIETKSAIAYATLRPQLKTACFPHDRLTTSSRPVIFAITANVPKSFCFNLTAAIIYPTANGLVLYFTCRKILIRLAVICGLWPSVLAASTAASIGYDVEVTGQLPDGLLPVLLQASQTLEYRKRHLASPAMLKRRIDGDSARFQKILRSRGFYAGRIESRINEATTLNLVTFNIDIGPVFLIGDYAIQQALGSDIKIAPILFEDLGIEIGMAANASRLKGAEGALLDYLRAAGHPDPRIVDARYVVDHDRTTVSTIITVEPGATATFGPLTIEGLDTVKERYVRVIADWRVGRKYDPKILRELRERLSGVSLFKTVIVEVADSADVDGHRSVLVELSERDHRVVAVGARVSSSDDFLSGNASWEHRNLFGGGETATLETTLSTLEQEALARLRKPQFLIRGQTFIASAAIHHEKSDAFEEASLTGFAGLERKASETITTNIGIAGELASLSDSVDESFFGLVGVPVSIARDTRDSTLDAKKGSLISATITPWANVSDSSSGFVVGEVSGAIYQVLGTPRIVGAARARIGGIIAGGLRDIPVNKRFFAGGGSSIRGYEFRHVGPLDVGGDPTGGQSVIEFGAELRLGVTDEIEVVPFIDGGQVYETTIPSFEGQMRWAVGLGVRYKTPIGPIRMDVAFPVNRRDGIDDLFQFYISIGQAF
jgi:translocation and assembly module TamA